VNRDAGDASQEGQPDLHDLQIAVARWQSILATARDAIVAIDRRACITLFNPAAEQMFGYAAEEVIGRGVTKLMPRPYCDEHDEYLRRYERTGEARAIGRIRSVQGLRKDGRTFPIELSVSEARVGDEVLYTAILRDISERDATEAALRAERDFAARLIDTAQMIVLVLDSAGRIERYNAFMEQLSGRPLASARGGDCFDTFVPARDRQRMRTLFRSAMEGRAQFAHTGAIVAADGSERQIEWRGTPLRDGDGRQLGVLCAGLDISERAAAAQAIAELQRAAQERGRLAEVGAITAKVVHDLGNPLAALSMQTQLILRRIRRGDAAQSIGVREPAEQILRTLRRLEGLVHEFTDFARDQRLDRRWIDVAGFLASCIDLWQPFAAERDIELALLPNAGELPVLHADELMLRRVLDNLIKNAIEAVGHGPGAVRLGAGTTGADRLCITVEDDGPGIADGIDVFELFATTKPEGTGIGLAVAKQIIAAHGGSVAYAPRAPRGTIFRIEMPLDGAPRDGHRGRTA
jgi:two-component system, LuxR family, sensor kinase FixL